MRRLLAISLVLAAAAAGRSAEPGPAPASPPSTENSLSTAKRDFDSIQAAREDALHPKADLPRLTVPEMQLGNPTPRTAMPDKDAEAELKKKGKSPNWLVDAMQKDDRKPDDRMKGGKSNTGKERELAEAWDADKTAARNDFALKPARRAESSSESRDRRETEPPPNPLAPFLAGWMTSQDYALLQTPAVGTSGGGSAVAVPGVATSVIDPSIAMRAETRALVKGAEKPGFQISSQTENPYLSALNEPGPTLGALTVPVGPVMSPVISAPAPARYEPAPVPPAKIPDFAKPANDDRYFKPLKRF